VLQWKVQMTGCRWSLEDRAFLDAHSSMLRRQKNLILCMQVSALPWESTWLQAFTERLPANHPAPRGVMTKQYWSIQIKPYPFTKPVPVKTVTVALQSKM
jgi:hypothetical protein